MRLGRQLGRFLAAAATGGAFSEELREELSHA